MSEEKIELTSDEQLTVCNKISLGMKPKDALALIRKSRGMSAPAPTGAKKKKPSSKEKKVALAKAIEAAGGEAPAEDSSVAKFEEALTKATAEKEAAEKEAENLM